MYNRVMNHRRLVLLAIPLFALLLMWACATKGQDPQGQVTRTEDTQNTAPGSFAGWVTNGPGVFRSFIQSSRVIQGQPVAYAPPPDDLPLEVRRVMATFRAAGNVKIVKNTTNLFQNFLPDSLNNLIWTNFIAHTNGREMIVWSVRSHPAGWPNQPPALQWNPKCLLSGMKGMTALSPCWQEEGNPGQLPITALTKRHGYMRGHDLGPDHVGANFAGRKVWFLTGQNTVVQTTVAREAVRTSQTSGRDYTILLFSSDLPDSIQPMRVVHANDVFNAPPTKYKQCLDAPCPMFKTEQTDHVAAEVPPFTMDTFKGGDSGSPNMVPLPVELVFW